MMQPILELIEVSKKYGKNEVVHPITMQLQKGHIYGLIGPNGAGKTTIMKMIAGLTANTSGEIRAFGSSMWGKGSVENRNRMSFMVETPYLDGSMTARQNMQYIRYVRGVADESRIDEVLDYVGLSDTGKKKVSKFSLGMRQRLGIGMALLSSPELMVLDEPVNGLDPEGIVDVRNMLRKLCHEREMTILISSHLLSELSELCTDFAIINHGSLVDWLSREELMEKCRSYIAVKTDNISETVACLEQKLDISEYKLVSGDELRIYERLDEVELVSRTITDSGFTITKFTTEGESLEEYYLSRVD
ncbi:MAG: ABC transporter ATP-binding protein [Lachnospiraceae bacterium]|nr:ABC transporter ATP-binding protein [Lachnospiraceae bacterium]